MPTDKPRIAITLAPRTMDLLDRVSAARGITKSAFLEELLEEVREPMERVVVLFEMAKAAPAKSLETFRRAVLDAEKGILPLAESGMAQMDLLIQAAAQAGRPAERPSIASAPAGRPAPRATKGGPPPTNRGVPVTGGSQKVTKLSAARKARKAAKTGGRR